MERSGKLPLVSVLCFCRNAAATIRRCVDSILSQDYTNIEVIVQDGASTDGTTEILESYGSRIDLISETDEGPGDAMFRSINRANGEIFITCLSDETMLPHAVSWGVRQLMRHPEAGAIYGDHHNIDLEGNITAIVRPQAWDFAKVLCSEFIPPFCTSFFRRDCFKKIGLNAYTGCGEFEIWIRMGKQFPIVYVPGLVAQYGVHAGELSFQAELVELQARGKIKTLEKFFSEPDLLYEYKCLKEDALSGIHSWLVNSYCNMEQWERACDYFYTAHEADKNQRRLYLAGMRLLNHGLELINTGEHLKAHEFVELSLNFPHVFKNIDLTHVHRIYNQFYDFAPGSNISKRKSNCHRNDKKNRKQVAPYTSKLDRLIAPEILNDAFFEDIKQLSAEEGIEHILEIGSSDGRGSTAAFVSGMDESDSDKDYNLYCLELSEPRFERLRLRYEKNNRVFCYRASTVPLKKFPTEKQVADFYVQTPTALNAYPLEQVLGWLRQDKDYLQNSQVCDNGIEKIRKLHHIENFDLVLIDGSEFTGCAELDEVYGARIIMLDDINGFKNFRNYSRLKQDPCYALDKENWKLRNGYAIFRRLRAINRVPVHFFTIVLNGEPFIRYHLDVFRQLPFAWHWHIIEGVAELKHDTAWSLKNGGRIASEFHRNGLSVDGTSDYLDRIVSKFPDQVTVYRKTNGAFWGGKLEMINAPMGNLPDHCLLWQIDADEIWKVEQINKVYDLFDADSQRSAAYFHCHFFVGAELLTTTAGTYSHNDSFEWIRVWRYRNGMQWKSHEPPCLMVNIDGRWVDTAKIAPFTHQETEAAGLVFTHHAYSLESQVRFKESYYGYHDAVAGWRRLQQAKQLPLRLGDYLPWVKDHCQADHMKRRIIGKDVPPVGLNEILNNHGEQTQEGSRPRIVVDGVIFQLQAKQKQGISRVWSNLIVELARQMPEAKITVLQRKGFSVPNGNTAIHEVPVYSWDHTALLDQDDEMLREVCRDLNADIFISTYYTRAPGVINLVMMHDMIPEKLGFDLDQAEWVAKQRVIEAADAFVCVSQTTRTDLIELYPQVANCPMKVAYNALDSCFRPPSREEIESLRNNLNLHVPYVILVGNRHGYKYGIEVLSSLAAIKDADKPAVLCVGGESRLSSSEVRLKDRLDIRYIGHLDDHALSAAYGGALALLVGSRYEGFGLPVIEAMACGCPVIAHASPAVSEIGGQAVCYTDFCSAEAVNEALKKISDASFRQTYIQKGIERIPKFQWATTARIIGQFIQTLVDQPAIMLTAIVSTYNAAQFIEGCLEDLENQTVADKMEIIVIDSASQQDEAAVIRDFQARHRNIKYFRTQMRESVYQAWNRGIKFASGKYITNANTDDRHRRDALEQMVNTLEAKPDIDLVYADVLKTRTPNETFDQCTPTGVLRWLDWDREALLKKGCFIGPQPVWRRKVHETYGYFDESFRVCADYEFWLRISQTGNFYHVANPLGLYLERPDSIEHANYETRLREERQISAMYKDAAANGTTIVRPSPGPKHKVPYLDQNSENKSAKREDNHRLNEITAQRSSQGGQIMYSPDSILNAIRRLANGAHGSEACWFLEKLIAEYPDMAEAHSEMAQLAYGHQDMDRARKHYGLAAELAPDSFEAQKNLGDFRYAVEKDGPRALEMYVKALAVKPDNVETLILAGHVAVSLHQFDKAQLFYSRAISIEPENEEVRRYLDKLEAMTAESKTSLPSIEDLLASAQQKAGKGDRLSAISSLEAVVIREPENALAHNDLGVLYYDQGEKDKALEHYQKAAMLMPENEVFQKNLADLYWSGYGDAQNAMERYVQALKIDPQDVESLLGCTRVCMEIGKNDDASVFLNCILDLEPWNEQAREMMNRLDAPAQAGAYDLSAGPDEIDAQSQNKATTEDRQAAIDNLMQRIVQSPLDAGAFNDLGVLHFESGDKEKALYCYEQAVKLQPRQPNFVKNLADFYLMEQGRVQEALKLYVNVLEDNPEDVDCLISTGLICSVMGKMDDARHFYQRVLEIEPWNQMAVEALDKIDSNKNAVEGQTEFKKAIG